MSDTNAVAAVDTPKGRMRRAIQMGYFRDDAITGKVIATKEAVTVGQIIGTIYDVKERTGEINGDVTKSLQAIGEFEAVIYKTGEIMESGSAYLPKYFLESVQAMLLRGANSNGLSFAVEVDVVPTGKSIPIAYEVRNLIQRPAESPMEAIKRELQRSNALRVSPPVAVARAVIEYDPVVHDAPADEQGVDEDDRETSSTLAQQEVEDRNEAPAKPAAKSKK